MERATGSLNNPESKVIDCLGRILTHEEPDFERFLSPELEAGAALPLMTSVTIDGQHVRVNAVVLNPKDEHRGPRVRITVNDETSMYRHFHVSDAQRRELPEHWARRLIAFMRVHEFN